MKAYKGFNKDMSCRGFKFKEGEMYHEDEAKLCEKGFHACKDPLDCFGYYNPTISEYHEVELDEVTAEREGNTKVCGKTIKIGKKLNITDIIKAHFEYVKNINTKIIKIGNPNKQASVGDCRAVSVGDYSTASAGHSGAASAGSCSSVSVGHCGTASARDCSAASAGDCSIAFAGNHSMASAGRNSIASVGYCSTASVGDFSTAFVGDFGIASAGESSAAFADYKGIASTGDFGTASAREYGTAVSGKCGTASAGECGKAVSGGNASVGKNGVAVAKGNECMVKGELGSILIIIEEKVDCSVKEWSSAIVDGKIIKADTWYALKDGKFVEAKGNSEE